MKVVVRRAGSGALAASSLIVAASGAAGCAETAGADEAELVASDAQALDAGSAMLVAGGWPGGVELTVTNSTTDEFVRVGQSLSVSFPAWLLWEALYPSEAFPELSRLQALQPTITVTFLDQGTALTTETLATSWTGAELYSLSAVTTSFIVPAGADALQLTVTIRDGAQPSSIATVESTAIRQIQVFGGDLPNKTALFDSFYGSLRTRIIEGSSPVRGSSLLLGYTDWRADTLVSRSSINTQIGMRQGYGRFGLYTTPIYGTIEHEVTVGYAFNDGSGWRSEQPLAANAASRLLPAGRTDYEKTLAVPQNATRLSLYFHVRTYLVADYSGYTGITEQWYAPGSKNLVRERWDNPYGAYTNYEFALEAR